MSHRSVIDGFDFAAGEAMLRGTLPVGELARLHDVLASTSGVLDYTISGMRDEQGRAALRLQVDGALRLTCQRCLSALKFPVSIDSTLVLAASQREIDRDPIEAQGPDRIIGSRDMAVWELLEDELLLAVPFAPRHERCAARAEARDDRHRSPFEELRDMLGAKRSKRG